MAGMEVDLALNARKFQAGVQDAERELEQLTTVFDELVESSTKLESAAVDALGATGDEAADAEREVKDLTRRTEELADEFRDAARKVDDLGDDADTATDKARRGFGRAEDGVREFRDEAGQTARETAASFGSVEDAIGGVQELAAQGLGSFGPVGAAAGLAVAGAIGLGVTAFEELQEAEQESRERAAEWADAYIEANNRVLTATQTLARQRNIFTDADMYREAGDNAREWGVSVETAVAAMAGETWALAAANESLTAREQEAFEASVRLADGGEALADVLGGATAETRNGRDALNQLTGEMERGRDAADEYSRGLVLTAENAVGATRATDELGDTVVTLPDGHQIYIDAETGQATDNVDDIEARIYGLPDGNVSINVDTSSADRAMARWTARLRTVTVTPVVPPGWRVPQ